MRDHKKYEDIASRIRTLIEQDSLTAGNRLPTERELSERFGVSRATIRQAEIQLQALGLVEVKTGSGVYVSDRLTANNDKLPEVTALELTEARSLLESELAALAAVHITEPELEKLSECIELMNNSLPDNDEIADAADRDFHLTIAQASRNTAILHTIELFWRMRNEIEAVRTVYQAVCTHDTASRGKEHSDILDALRKHDPMQARIAMRAHFLRLLESMVDVSTTQAIEAAHRRADEERQRFLMNPALRSVIRTNATK